MPTPDVDSCASEAMSRVLTPDLSEELALAAAGYTHVAGIDEAGRGAWAGPVYAAAVVLPLERPNLPDYYRQFGYEMAMNLGGGRLG